VPLLSEGISKSKGAFPMMSNAEIFTSVMSDLSSDLRRSLTWDQGKEMARSSSDHCCHWAARVLLSAAFPIAAGDQ
jgi:IS30 family transposase